MSHRKRKHRQRSDTHSNQYDLHLQASSSSTRPDHTLFIVAHEADIIRGPQAARLADSLEVGTNVDGQGGSRIGEGLIKWESKVGSSSRDAEGGDIWVDRYDARLLLDALPPFFASIVDHTTTTTTASSNDDDDDALGPSRPDSPGSGWSDLPSDAEDIFFLTPEETADLHRTKRLRHLDALRTARLRALSPDETNNTDGYGDINVDADPWGSDEEPDEQQMDLMRRTAAHTVRANNDAQLRARILAHHGADVRFAFLRGRWSHAWALAQAEVNRAVLEDEREKAQSAGALGGLTGYGSGSEEDDAEDDDDDDDDDDAVDGSSDDITERTQVLEGAAEDGQATQEAQSEEVALRAAQEARRAKAREWAEKRRAAKALADGEKKKSIN